MLLNSFSRAHMSSVSWKTKKHKSYTFKSRSVIEWSQWAFNSNDQTQDQQFSNIFLIGAWRQTTLQRWHRWLTVSLQLHFYTLKLFGWRRPAESYQRQLWRHQRSFQKIPYWFVWGEGSLRMDLKQRIHIFCCLLMNLRTVTFFY